MLIPIISFILLHGITSPLPEPTKLQSILTPYKPNPQQVLDNFKSADSIRATYARDTRNLWTSPTWIGNGSTFWYRWQTPLKSSSDKWQWDYLRFDPTSNQIVPLFNNRKLLKQLNGLNGDTTRIAKLNFQAIQVLSPSQIDFKIEDKNFEYNPETNSLEKLNRNVEGSWAAPDYRPSNQDSYPSPEPQGFGRFRNVQKSPNGDLTAKIIKGNIVVVDKDGQSRKLTNLNQTGARFVRISWASDNQHLVAEYQTDGDQDLLYNIESTPAGGGRPVLHQTLYRRAGDKLDTEAFYILDAVTGTSTKVGAPIVDNWYGPNFTWAADHKSFFYEVLDRGVQRYRVYRVNAISGAVTKITDERAKTFIDSTALYLYYCKDSNECIYSSEIDGWRHLYLYNDLTGKLENQITFGNWVTRGVTYVDEKNRVIYFQGSGQDPNEDPYFLHEYKINFDGTHLVDLTPEPSDHAAFFSPDHQVIFDAYSTADQTPHYDVRSAITGKLLADIGSGDDSDLAKDGWKPPTIFHAKGRDGKTDIWGIAYLPTQFDPHKSYPVIEDIYAGPHDSFVPKRFAAWSPDESLAELGFIVVQIDGMGTRNRSRAFHDVCWQNLKDAGFPDRILWIKALAKQIPQMDLSRVGIFGTSAGGQESTAALLFHPDFYKVGVSSCGCHDNRLDKVWWNEQWMGYPVGPQYSESSNIDNAYRLKGHLLLFVAELDTNVDPASTIRLLDAFMKSGRDVSFLMIPGSNHTDGGPYGERKRRDFFLRYLLHVNPPDWNAAPPAPVTRWDGK